MSWDVVRTRDVACPLPAATKPQTESEVLAFALLGAIADLRGELAALRDDLYNAAILSNPASAALIDGVPSSVLFDVTSGVPLLLTTNKEKVPVVVHVVSRADVEQTGVITPDAPAGGGPFSGVESWLFLFSTSNGSADASGHAVPAASPGTVLRAYGVVPTLDAVLLPGQSLFAVVVVSANQVPSSPNSDKVPIDFSVVRLRGRNAFAL